MKMKYNLSILIVTFLMSIGVNAQLDRSIQPKPGPAPKVSIDSPGEFELKNGLKVLVVENNKLPRVSYSLTIDNPPISEGNKAGVSSLLSAMLGDGTTNIPKDDFNEEVDFLGANISFGSQSAFASCLSKYSERILELMADAAINPLLTEEEFQKQKDQLIEGLKTTEKDVSSIAGRVGSALSYGLNHPAGEITSEETVNNITLADVKAFYEENFNLSRGYLVVVGDVEFRTIKKQIQKYFGDWKPRVEISRSTPKVSSNVQYTQINFVDMPNAVQSDIRLTNNVDLKMKDDDYHAALITNYILGGGSSGYLYQNLREDKGYTYGSYSSIGTNRYGVSRFSATAQVRNEVTDSSVVEMIKEIKRIRTEPVDAEALKLAKAKYVGNFVMGLERPQTVANYALNIKLNDLPENFYTTYLQKINAVTADDVMRVANSYYKTENARIIVVGKGSDVLENLEKTGIPIMYYDTYANPTEKPNYEVEMPEGVDVNSVLNDYIEAIGGKAKVDAVNSLVVKYEAEAMGSKVMQEEKRVDGKLAQNTSMNGTPMMGFIVTQEAAYMKQGPNKQPLPEAMATDMKAATGLFMEINALNSGNAKLQGYEDIDGKQTYKVEIPGTTVSYTMFYDVESGLKVKEVQTINMGGQSQVQEAMLKDYKEYEGILFPETKESVQMGQPITQKLIEVMINSGVSDADFD